MRLLCIVLCYVLIGSTLALSSSYQRPKRVKENSKTKKFNLFLKKINSIKTQIDFLEVKMKRMEDKMDSMEHRMDSMDGKIDPAEDTVVTVKDEMNSTENETKSVKGMDSMEDQKSSTVNETMHFESRNIEDKPCNCLDLMRAGVNKSGIYRIYPHSRPSQVYCDMETDGGGWLVFQRRADGSENFYRGWNDYRDGFGDMNHDFWLGNENLYQILHLCGDKHELRVDLEDFSDERRFAKYSTFDIYNDNYRLRIEGYTGNAGNSLGVHDMKQFSTFDNDNEVYKGNCAEIYKGGWWYSDGCHLANLNGLYLNGSMTSFGDGVSWYYWKGHQYSLKFTEMKFRPTE